MTFGGKSKILSIQSLICSHSELFKPILSFKNLLSCLKLQKAWTQVKVLLLLHQTHLQ